MTIENIAQVCHEVNKSFCIAMDDFSQLSWEDAPDWQKDSAINGVKFHLDNPLAGPEASHDSWMTEKLENGWKLGHVKDANEKTHPCILPFSQLPKEQQAKDYLFRQVVHSLSIHLEKQLTSY